MWFTSAHGPGADHFDSKNFWIAFDRLCEECVSIKTSKKVSLHLLADMNARVGSVCSSSVGAEAAVPQDGAETPFPPVA